MRVCMVHNEYARPSGEEAVVQCTERLLRDRGHQVVSFRRHSRDIARRRLGKLRAFFTGLHSPSSVRAMRELLRQHRPDVVHVHNVFPLISPSVLATCRRAGVPVVMSVHNYRLICPSGLLMTAGEVCERCEGGREYWCVLRNCERDLLKSLGYALRGLVARRRHVFRTNVTMYAALTEFQRTRLIAEGFPGDRVAIVPNMAGLPPTGNGALGDYVGYAGRISPEKGITVLLEAARRCPDTSFRAAGNCERMPGVLAQAPPNLEFVGHLRRDAVGRFYAASRLVVLCSTWFEGFPSSLAEAMAYGKPVVCSRIGGLPEIVDDGVTGLLFGPGRADELAGQIRRLWDDSGLCRRMGRAARDKARREYSPARYYERLMAVYERALALGPGGPPRRRSDGQRGTKQP